MAAEEDDRVGSRRHGSHAARKIRGRPRHGTELGSWCVAARTPSPFTSPRPGTSTRSTSRPSRTRPAPQSQSLFRSYGSNLPTSLTYNSLSTRGSSSRRLAADMGTNRRECSMRPSPGFSCSEVMITVGSPSQLRCSSRSRPHLPASGFQ